MKAHLDFSEPMLNKALFGKKDFLITLKNCVRNWLNIRRETHQGRALGEQ
jgi:hypothetical protein